MWVNSRSVRFGQMAKSLLGTGLSNTKLPWKSLQLFEQNTNKKENFNVLYFLSPEPSWHTRFWLPHRVIELVRLLLW